MPEGPVEVHGARAKPVRVPPAGPEDGPAAYPAWKAQNPKVVIKADLLPAVSVLSLVALLGMPLGWLWSRLAPPQESTIDRSGNVVPVLVESFHRFDALAIFMLFSTALGVLTGAAVWMLRGRRGPVILLAAVLGSAVAAWLGMRVGTGFAAGLYPMPSSPKVGDVFLVAPEVTEFAALLCQPLAVALVYGLAASWNGLDDLGRRG